MNMFLRHLLNNCKTYLKNEQVYYQLINRLENAEIRRPFFVISPERLKIGKNVLIQRYCHFHCGGMPWSFGKGSIAIGDGCVFSENNILYGAGEIEIGNYTMTGPLVMIFSSRGNYSLEYAKLPKEVHQFGKVKIGSYVRIFSNVVIGPGVTIGDGAVIGSGSVVGKDVPEWSFVVGNPAQVINKRGYDRPLEERKNKKNDEPPRDDLIIS
jgi:acetyltransferase-like isoleucine patch superfamily enzyme